MNLFINIEFIDKSKTQQQKAAKSETKHSQVKYIQTQQQTKITKANWTNKYLTKSINKTVL
jgi:hypothetical protein